jgi:hypothetical protein
MLSETVGGGEHTDGARTSERRRGKRGVKLKSLQLPRSEAGRFTEIEVNAVVMTTGRNEKIGSTRLKEKKKKKKKGYRLNRRKAAACTTFRRHMARDSR